MKFTLRSTTYLRPLVFDGEKLRINYDSVEDIPESFRSLYGEKEGKFYLNGIEGIKTDDDVRKVSEALRKERNDHKTLRESLLKHFGQNYDLADIVTRVDRVGELEAQLETAGDPKNQKKIEELVEARLKAKLAPLERENTELKGKLTTVESEVGTLRGERATRTVHDAIREAATKAKILPEAFEDALMLAERDFIIDEDGNVVTKTTAVNPGEWLTTMQQKRPHWWAPSSGGGAGGSGNGGGNGKNPWAADQWNMTEQGRMYRENPAKAATLASLAGTKIGGTRPIAKK